MNIHTPVDLMKVESAAEYHCKVLKLRCGKRFSTFNRRANPIAVARKRRRRAVRKAA